MQACNITCPRDCEFQERHLGKEISRDEARAGDIVFFRSNHVGLLVDETTLIHASDRNLAVSIDDLDEYATWRAKMGKAGGKNQIKMFKRL
jgi:cell wall-associated NlpC family hydrolase